MGQSQSSTSSTQNQHRRCKFSKAHSDLRKKDDKNQKCHGNEMPIVPQQKGDKSSKYGNYCLYFDREYLFRWNWCNENDRYKESISKL